MDLFEAYGWEEDDGIDELVPHEDDGDLRARLREIILEQRETFGHVTSLCDLEDKLDGMIRVHQKSPNNNREKKEPEARNSRHSKPLGSLKEVSERISVMLEQHISATFSQIFQALLVILKSQQHLANNECEDTEEAAVFSRRSKEFEVRLGRITYELRQKVQNSASTQILSRTDILFSSPCQVLACSTALGRLYTQPRSPKLQLLADGCLQRSLRTSHSVLKAYLGHLPLSQGRVYPRGLDDVLDLLLEVAQHSLKLGYKAAEFKEDVEKLAAAARSFHTEVEEKRRRSMTDKTTTETSKIQIINNLARERFGEVAKKATNIKKKNPSVILPRGNKLLDHRASLARRKRFGVQDHMVGREEISSGSDDHLRGFSSQPRLGVQDAVENEKEEESTQKWTEGGCGNDQLQTTTTERVGRTLSPPDGFSDSRNERGRLMLDLDDEEFARIVASRRTRTNRGVSRSLFNDIGGDPMRTIGDLSDRLADELIKDVCDEMASPRLLENILKHEFILVQ